MSWLPSKAEAFPPFRSRVFQGVFPFARWLLRATGVLSLLAVGDLAGQCLCRPLYIIEWIDNYSYTVFQN